MPDDVIMMWSDDKCVLWSWPHMVADRYGEIAMEMYIGAQQSRNVIGREALESITTYVEQRQTSFTFPDSGLGIRSTMLANRQTTSGSW